MPGFQSAELEDHEGASWRTRKGQIRAQRQYSVLMYASAPENCAGVRWARLAGLAAERQAAGKVAIFWPNQADRGTHINISGAGVTAASSQPEQAAALIEFLAQDDAQRWYAETNNEYPVREDIAPSELLTSWGKFKADQVPMTELGRRNADAVMAMDRARWK